MKRPNTKRRLRAKQKRHVAELASVFEQAKCSGFTKAETRRYTLIAVKLAGLPVRAFKQHIGA